MLQFAEPGVDARQGVRDRPEADAAHQAGVVPVVELLDHRVQVAALAQPAEQCRQGFAVGGVAAAGAIQRHPLEGFARPFVKAGMALGGPQLRPLLRPPCGPEVEVGLRVEDQRAKAELQRQLQRAVAAHAAVVAADRRGREARQHLFAHQVGQRLEGRVAVPVEVGIAHEQQVVARQAAPQGGHLGIGVVRDRTGEHHQQPCRAGGLDPEVFAAGPVATRLQHGGQGAVQQGAAGVVCVHRVRRQPAPQFGRGLGLQLPHRCTGLQAAFAPQPGQVVPGHTLQRLGAVLQQVLPEGLFVAPVARERRCRGEGFAAELPQHVAERTPQCGIVGPHTPGPGERDGRGFEGPGGGVQRCGAGVQRRQGVGVEVAPFDHRLQQRQRVLAAFQPGPGRVERLQRLPGAAAVSGRGGLQVVAEQPGQVQQPPPRRVAVQMAQQGGQRAGLAPARRLQPLLLPALGQHERRARAGFVERRAAIQPVAHALRRQRRAAPLGDEFGQHRGGRAFVACVQGQVEQAAQGRCRQAGVALAGDEQRLADAVDPGGCQARRGQRGFGQCGQQHDRRRMAPGFVHRLPAVMRQQRPHGARLRGRLFECRGREVRHQQRAVPRQRQARDFGGMPAIEAGGDALAFGRRQGLGGLPLRPPQGHALVGIEQGVDMAEQAAQRRAGHGRRAQPGEVVDIGLGMRKGRQAGGGGRKTQHDRIAAVARAGETPKSGPGSVLFAGPVLQSGSSG